LIIFHKKIEGFSVDRIKATVLASGVLKLKNFGTLCEF